MSHSDETQGTTSHRSEGDNARVTVKISLKPRYGKEDLKAKYKVEKYNLSEGYSMGPSLQALVPRGTPDYVEHGENYVERIMRALYHFKQCALIGPSGTGKSVCEGEQVLVSLGEGLTLTTVGRLFESLARRHQTRVGQDGWEVLPLSGADVRVLSMDLGEGELAWRRPSALARSMYRGKVVEVTTRTNRVLRATPEHSFVVEGRSMKASEIRAGTRIPVARRIPPHGGAHLAAVQAADHVPGARLAAGPSGAVQLLSPPSVEPDERFAWLLGAFVAAGCVGDGFASISGEDRGIAGRFARAAESLGLTASRRGVQGLRVCGDRFVSLLSAAALGTRDWGEGGWEGSCKKVPDFVYSMGEGARAAFLRGAFEAGGRDVGSEVVLRTSGADLANGLVVLCEQAGVFPVLRVRRGAGPGYEVAIDREAAAELGIRLSRRGEKRGSAGPPTEGIEGTQGPPRAPGSRLPGASVRSSPEPPRGSGPSVLWDEVVKVERLDYEGWVYDFQVPGTETFVAGLGGVVTHNTHITYLVAELAGLPLWEINCGLQTSVYDLFGRFVGLGKENWVDGQIVSWCRYGGILYLDEANMMKQDIATRLNPILDTRGHMVLNEKDNEVIPRHPNGYVIISMNPYSAEFAGTKPLNAAFRRRMTVWIDFDYLSVGSKIAPDEVEMIAQRAKIDPPVAEKLVRVAAEIRRQYKAGDLPYAPSVGDLVNWGTLVADGLTPAVAAEETIIALTADDPEVQNNVRRVVRMVVGDSKAGTR
jgi:nitric oxide reductase NorQ protein